MQPAWRPSSQGHERGKTGSPGAGPPRHRRVPTRRRPAPAERATQQAIGQPRLMPLHDPLLAQANRLGASPRVDEQFGQENSLTPCVGGVGLRRPSLCMSIRSPTLGLPRRQGSPPDATTAHFHGQLGLKSRNRASSLSARFPTIQNRQFLGSRRRWRDRNITLQHRDPSVQSPTLLKIGKARICLRIVGRSAV